MQFKCKPITSFFPIEVKKCLLAYRKNGVQRVRMIVFQTTSITIDSDMAIFHNVDIYRGSVLATTTTRLEVAVMSPVLREVMTSIKTCDGCKESTTIIFPDEDETQNTIEVVFKSNSYRSGSSRYSVIECKFLLKFWIGNFVCI